MANVINGPDDVRKALMAHPDQFAQTLTEKLLTYALGRGGVLSTCRSVRAIVRDAAADDDRFSCHRAGDRRAAREFQMQRPRRQDGAPTRRDQMATSAQPGGHAPE